MGLPLSLEGVGAVLGLEKQKLTEGKELIKLFCQPWSSKLIRACRWTRYVSRWAARRPGQTVCCSGRMVTKQNSIKKIEPPSSKAGCHLQWIVNGW